MHFDEDPEAGFSENFFRQITAEEWRMTHDSGKHKWEWVKIRERNEALDCCVYATAAEALISPNYEFLKERLTNPQPAQKPKQARKRRVAGGIQL